jgi:hypothetical protein
MTTQSPLLEKRLYTQVEFQAIGEPERTRLYELRKAGKLYVVKDATRLVKITAAEVDRNFRAIEQRAGT